MVDVHVEVETLPAAGLLGSWSLPVLLIVGTALLVVGYLGWIAAAYWSTYRKSLELGNGLPMVPAKFPGGSAWFFVKHGFDANRKAVEEYGQDGIVFMLFGSTPFVLLDRQEHIKAVFQAASHHSSPAWVERYSSSQYNPISFWLGEQSVLFNDIDRHEEWKFLRRLLSRPFLSINLNKLRPAMTNVHESFMDYLAGEINSPNKYPCGYPMEDFLFSLTLDVLGESSFSQNFGGLRGFSGGKTHVVVHNFHKLMKITNIRSARHTATRPWLLPKWVWLPLPGNSEFKKARNDIRTEVDKLIAERERENLTGKRDQADLLQMMIDEQDSETGRSLSRDQLRDNLITILLAGFDTTGTALTYMLHSMASNPEVQKKVQEEVAEVMPMGTPTNNDTAAQLVYCRCVMKEALRLYAPVVNTIRTPTKDVSLEGGKWVIPKHTTVMIPMFDAMRSEHNWDEPLKFKPERHDAHYGEASDGHSKYHAFMPFAHGGRNCIGMRFAEMSAVLTLACLARRFTFSVPEDYVMEPVFNMPMQRPKEKLRLIVRERA